MPPTDLDPDVAAWQQVLDATYTSAKLGPVVVVDGYALHVGVEAGQLVVTDGVGAHRRKRRISRANRTVKRLVILGRSGTVTLAALRWCADVGVSVSMVDTDGSLTAVTTAPNPNDARLRRSQALAAGSDGGLGIARSLIRAKLHGHAVVLATQFGEDGVAEALRENAARLDALPDIPSLREVEALSANVYFAVWSRDVRVEFATRERARVPEHWTTPSPRRSALAGGGSPRKALDPVNAMLNYAYTLGESVARHSCHVVGLDPALGVMHSDKRHRDSMALDVLEVLRPTIDATVLRMLAARRFRRVDFVEESNGQCRLTESVTHPLAASMPAWTAALAPVVEAVAHDLAEASPGSFRGRTPLTRTRHRAAQRAVLPMRRPRVAPVAAELPSCLDCGKSLASKGAKRCGDCWPVARARAAAARADAARTSQRAQWAATGVDPTQTSEARSKRVESLTAERALRDEWNRAHAGEHHDRAAFAREVQPGLADVPIPEIMAATGLSSSAASRVRRQILVPHPRHWEALRRVLDAGV